MKRQAAEWGIALLAILAGLGLVEWWKALLRRLPDERAGRAEALESGGRDDA